MSASAWPSEYSRRSLVRVEFYTRSHHVSGDMEVNRWRIADVLNDRSRPFLLIQNAVREPLPELARVAGADLARMAQYLQIAKEWVVFAIPQETQELAAARQQYLSTLYSERAQAEAAATAPPFEVRGTVHLRRLSQLRQALEELPAEFLPMTHMEATYLPDPRLRVSADLAMINRPLAELFALSAESTTRTSRSLQ